MKKIPLEGLVLDGGFSDHRPFLKDLWYQKFPTAPLVRFCTFNCAKGDVDDKGKRRDIDEVIAEILSYTPHILGLQEVKRGDGIVQHLREAGYIVRYEAPEFLVAGHRHRFRYVKHRGLVMSEHNYWLDQNEGLSVTWEDREVNTKLRTTCTHPPAHIVRENDPTWPNVFDVHRDVADRMEVMALNAIRWHEPWVDMRDSNIDRYKDKPVGPFKDWDWAYPERGMYVRAPEGTHHGAKGRRIDEMNTVLMSRKPVGQRGSR